MFSLRLERELSHLTDFVVRFTLIQRCKAETQHHRRSKVDFVGTVQYSVAGSSAKLPRRLLIRESVTDCLASYFTIQNCSYHVLLKNMDSQSRHVSSVFMSWCKINISQTSPDSQDKRPPVALFERKRNPSPAR